MGGGSGEPHAGRGRGRGWGGLAELLRDDGVGGSRGVQLAIGAADADGHASVDGFDIKFELRSALALDFDFHGI